MGKKQKLEDMDPVYGYILQAKLEPYVEWAKRWWTYWEDETFFETGTYPAKGAPAGMFIRFSRTLANSAIRNIQAFPFVSTPYLQLRHIPGGARTLVERICTQEGGYVIDGMRCIEKKNLHGTERNGQFVAFIPVEKVEEIMLEKIMIRGRYLWFKGDDILSLANGICDTHMQRRFQAYVDKEKNFV
jgi:hypothetical protein